MRVPARIRPSDDSAGLGHALYDSQMHVQDRRLCITVPALPLFCLVLFVPTAACCSWSNLTDTSQLRKQLACELLYTTHDLASLCMPLLCLALGPLSKLCIVDSVLRQARTPRSSGPCCCGAAARLPITLRSKCRGCAACSRPATARLLTHEGASSMSAGPASSACGREQPDRRTVCCSSSAICDAYIPRVYVAALMLEALESTAATCAHAVHAATSHQLADATHRSQLLPAAYRAL